MAEARRHPDVFSPEEAFAYVLGTGIAFNARTLETWRDKHGLPGIRLTDSFYYHRRDLDALIDRLFSISPTPTKAPLRMSSGGAR